MDPNFTVRQERKNKFPLSRGAFYALGIIFVLFIIAIISIYTYYPIEKTKNDEVSSVKLDKVQQIPHGLTLYKYKSFPKFLSAPKSVFPDPKNSNSIWLLGDGGVLRYNLEEGKINKTITGNDGVHNVPTSMAIIDDVLFVSFQGGFKEINLTTKETRVYGEKDGLVSGANVYLFPDPYDEKIIWIGTFNGLSKFNTEDGTFINFQKEAGIVGTVLHTDSRVRVGENFVWLIGTADVDSKGGIARYDKTSNTWKSWGPESFGKTGRVDFSEFDIDENRAFVVGSSNDIFAYKPNTDSWEVIAKGKKVQQDVI